MHSHTVKHRIPNVHTSCLVVKIKAFHMSCLSVSPLFLAMMHLFFLAGGVGENMNHHKEGLPLSLRL